MSKKRNSRPIKIHELFRPLPLLTDDKLHVALKNGDPDTFELTVSNSRVGHPSRAARYEFFERIPERREVDKVGGTRWHAPATDVTARLIFKLWSRDRLTFSDDAAVVYGYLVIMLEHQSLAMQRSAEYHDFVARRKLVTELAIPTPRFVSEYPLANDASLALHQRVGAANAIGSDGYGEFMEQGTGKTPLVIARIDHESRAVRLNEGRMHRTIVVAPKNVRHNWVKEFERFSTTQGRVVVLEGWQMERIRLLLEAVSGAGRPPNDDRVVIVCSYEVLSQSWDAIGGIPWDLAVLDELHFIKWHGTKRAKFAFMLRDQSKARMGLTGTPICNTVMDLYSQLEFLRKGGSGFSSFNAFRDFYGVYEIIDSARGQRRLVDVQNLPFLKERLARMSFIVKKAEALPDLPDKIYTFYPVEMTEQQRTVYDALCNQLFYEIENEMGDAKTVNANNILTKMLRLAQITSGFVCYSPDVDLDTGATVGPGLIEYFTPNPKLEKLIQLLKGSAETDEEEAIESRPANEKTIIWAHWIPDITAISQRLTAEGIDHVVFQGSTKDADRRIAEQRFNEDPNCRVFLGTAGAGGTGLNLIGYPPGRQDEFDTDVTMMIYYSQDWSHPKRAQSEDRAHRRGTRKSVSIVDLMVLDTIDDEIRARVTNKRVMALATQDLREILGKILKRKF